MKVLISGASGFIGSACTDFLKRGGHHVVHLVRKKTAAQNEISWDPANKQVHIKDLEGFDAVINLCGENIADGRWSEDKKRRIYDSRIQPTQLLANILPQLESPPKVWLNSSSVGYYGDTSDHLVKEGSPPGKGFLADVTVDWENATKPAEGKGMRIVLLRTGMVLGKNGGALQKMLTPFKLGLGGVMGSGNQYISWIALADFLSAILYFSENSLNGPFNLVSPRPATNFEFTKTLGKVLNRPTVLPTPPFLVRLVFGEIADALLLSSSRISPHRLLEAEFRFKFSDLHSALEASV